MCIRHLVAYTCTHLLPLDPHPTLCPTSTPLHPCTPIPTATIRSDDVCPACSVLFLGLIKRSIERQRRRSQGREVEETDVELDEVEREGFGAWLERGRGWAMLEVVRRMLRRAFGGGVAG